MKLGFFPRAEFSRTILRALFLVVLLLLQSVLAHSQAITLQSEVSVESEVAAALFAASATHAAALRVADARLRKRRDEIKALRVVLSAAEESADTAQAEVIALRTNLADRERAYVDDLAERDREYAQEIAVFRDAVTDIASTPEGLAALALFNDGDEIGAIAILDDLRAARDAAREAAANIRSAAEARRIAVLALQGRLRGKFSTADLIGRYEEITGLDPGVHRDWVELGRLYTAAGDLGSALNAAHRAADTAEDERDRSVALNELGDVQVAQGDLSSALESYRAGLEIRERLAEGDPGNAGWQRALSVSYSNIGDVQVAQGDLRSALESYRAYFKIAERLAEGDLGNAGWQRDLSVSYDNIGDVQVAQGDLRSALESYRAGLVVAERLAEGDPGNAGMAARSVGLV